MISLRPILLLPIHSFILCASLMASDLSSKQLFLFPNPKAWMLLFLWHWCRRRWPRCRRLARRPRSIGHRPTSLSPRRRCHCRFHRGMTSNWPLLQQHRHKLQCLLMLSWPPSKHIAAPWVSVTSVAPSGARTTSVILRSSSMLSRNCGISFKMKTTQQIQLPLPIPNLRFSWLFPNVLSLAVLLLASFNFQAQFRAFQCISCSIPAVLPPSSASRWQLSLPRCLPSSLRAKFVLLVVVLSQVQLSCLLFSGLSAKSLSPLTFESFH